MWAWILTTTLALAATPRDDLDEAWRMLREGDTTVALAVGARLADDPAWGVEATYLRAVALEADGRPLAAMAEHRTLLDGDHGRTADARFRLAQLHAQQHDWRQARRVLRPLTRRRAGLDSPTKASVLVYDAAWRIAQGRLGAGRRRAARVDRAAAADPTPWAALHAAEVQHHLGQALDVPLVGRRPRLRRALDRRADAFADAEAALEDLVPLGVPGPLVHSIVATGEAYATTARDLLTAPSGLSDPDDQARYDTLVRERALTVMLKARNYHELALDAAGRLAPGSDLVDLARDALDAVEEDVMALDGVQPPGE